MTEEKKDFFVSDISLSYQYTAGNATTRFLNKYYNNLSVFVNLDKKNKKFLLVKNKKWCLLVEIFCTKNYFMDNYEKHNYP